MRYSYLNLYRPGAGRFSGNPPYGYRSGAAPLYTRYPFGEPPPFSGLTGPQAVYFLRSSLNPFCARRSFKPVEWR